jgi:hypothetical protein
VLLVTKRLGAAHDRGLVFACEAPPGSFELQLHLMGHALSLHRQEPQVDGVRPSRPQKGRAAKTPPRGRSQPTDRKQRPDLVPELRRDPQGARDRRGPRSKVGRSRPG